MFVFAWGCGAKICRVINKGEATCTSSPITENIFIFVYFRFFLVFEREVGELEQWSLT